MRRVIATAVTGLAATAGVIGVTTASNATGSTTQTLTLVGHVKAMHIVDNGKKGDSAGDVGTISGTLSRGGKQVGRYLAVCTQFDARGHSICQFVLALPDGQLEIQSGYGKGLNGNRLVHDAIIGGTGAYAGATGDATGTEGGRTFKEVIHLQS
jgi:hypothetical protein